jgi:hypothetical protein
MNKQAEQQNLQPSDSIQQGFALVADEELKSVTGGIYLSPHYTIYRPIGPYRFDEPYYIDQKETVPNPM